MKSIETIKIIDSLLNYRNCNQCFVFTIDAMSYHGFIIAVNGSMYCYMVSDGIFLKKLRTEKLIKISLNLY